MIKENFNKLPDIYVAFVTENDYFGRLMHDFRCTDPYDMYYEPLKKSAIYFKENEKGVAQMCKLMEDFRREDLDEDRLEQIRTLAANLNMSYEQVMNNMNLKPEDKERYIQALNQNLQPAKK